MKIFIIFTCVLCIVLSLSPRKQNKKYRTTVHHNSNKSPYELEKDALTEALYCNDDDMKVGDNCFCGRISFSCCSSKDKCTGTFSRSCSKTVDDYECNNEVTKGMTYWQEMNNLKEKMQCSNKNYDQNSPCLCGKLITSCCKQKSYCDVGLLSESCDLELDNKNCDNMKQSLTNLTKPKYYTKYYQLFSSSEKIYMLSVVVMNILFIIL